jgi:hypothetical protein
MMSPEEKELVVQIKEMTVQLNLLLMKAHILDLRVELYHVQNTRPGRVHKETMLKVEVLKAV